MTEFDFEGVFDGDYLDLFGAALDERADAEADLVWRLLELAPGMEVLDLACGHGRLANRLAARGCRVTGVDRTAVFLRRARADAGGAQAAYVRGDMRALPFADGGFDRVINWFTAFGYFDDAGNRRVLAEAARVLRPGGRLGIEVNDRDWVMRNFEPSSVMDFGDALVVDRRHMEPLSGRMITERTVVRGGRVRRVPYFIRMFTFTELRAWLEGAGFGEVAGYDETGAPLAGGGHRMVTVGVRG
ncbi:MAG TPA: class I SAM-dependent methyltransferase [Streptosporangiaceae bacterium]|jgi:SAM-dependent methyltransferase